MTRSAGVLVLGWAVTVGRSYPPPPPVPPLASLVQSHQGSLRRPVSPSIGPRIQIELHSNQLGLLEKKAVVQLRFLIYMLHPPSKYV